MSNSAQVQRKQKREVGKERRLLTVSEEALKPMKLDATFYQGSKEMKFLTNKCSRANILYHSFNVFVVISWRDSV